MKWPDDFPDMKDAEGRACFVRIGLDQPSYAKNADGWHQATSWQTQDWKEVTDRDVCKQLDSYWKR